MRTFAWLYIILVASWLSVSACSDASDDQLTADSPTSLSPHRYTSVPTPRHDLSCQSDTIKLLFIGNSFAADVTDGFLPTILRSQRVKFVIGRLRLASCSVEMHLDNALADMTAYDYALFDNKGVVLRRDSVAISEALSSQMWTHVSFQQVSYLSGVYESFGTDLYDLMAYVSDRTCYDTQRIFYQTWAYGPDYTGVQYKRYGYDQMRMYDQIVSVSQRLAAEYDFDILVPGGTALQNARCTVLGNDLTKDGMHLSVDIGRYVVACAWCEALIGCDARLIKYEPVMLDDDQIAICRAAAHAAIVYPFGISCIELLPD